MGPGIIFNISPYDKIMFNNNEIEWVIIIMAGENAVNEKYFFIECYFITVKKIISTLQKRYFCKSFFIKKENFFTYWSVTVVNTIV